MLCGMINIVFDLHTKLRLYHRGRTCSCIFDCPHVLRVHVFTLPLLVRGTHADTVTGTDTVTDAEHLQLQLFVL